MTNSGRNRFEVCLEHMPIHLYKNIKKKLFNFNFLSFRFIFVLLYSQFVSILIYLADFMFKMTKVQMFLPLWSHIKN